MRRWGGVLKQGGRPFAPAAAQISLACIRMAELADVYLERRKWRGRRGCWGREWRQVQRRQGAGGARGERCCGPHQHSKKIDGASSPTSCSAAKLFFLKNLCMKTMPLVTAAFRRSRNAAMSCCPPAKSKAMLP